MCVGEKSLFVDLHVIVYDMYIIVYGPMYDCGYSILHL